LYHPRIVHLCNVKEVSPSKRIILKSLIYLFFDLVAEHGAYGNRSHGEYNMDKDDMIKDGRSFNTLDRRGDVRRYYSSFGSKRHYDHHHYHPCRRSHRGYFMEEFKKEK